MQDKNSKKGSKRKPMLFWESKSRARAVLNIQTVFETPIAERTVDDDGPIARGRETKFTTL